MMWLVLLVGLLVAFYFYCSKKNNYWASLGVKQTNNPVVFIGDGVQLFLKRVSFPDFLTGLYKQGAGHRYIGFYQFNQPFLLIRDPELIKLITVKDFDHFTDHRQFIPEDIDPLWANNLFARRGLRWRHMRTTLSPAFTSSKMKNLFVTLKETSERFLQNFNEESVELDFKDTLSRYTNDLIAATAFGVQIDSIKNRENEFFMMGKRITKALSGGNPLKFILFLVLPSLARLLGLSLFDKQASEFFDTLARDSLKYRRENKVVRPDMLNLLLEAQNEAIKNGETFTDEDISAQCMIFFLAGFDTISSFMSFMAHELAVNQDIQDKLRQEILETKQPLTYEALIKLPYLDMVISETMRKYPNMTSLDRLCTKDYVVQPTQPNEKPFTIKKDIALFLPAYAIHRDPEYYPNPDKFDPERFSEENKHNINQYAFIPFGIGPRACIGNRLALLETKTLFFHLLSKFRIVLSKKSCIPMKFDKKNFLMSAEGGFWYKLEKL